MDQLPSTLMSRKIITVNNPSAGQDWSQVASGSWLIKAISAKMTQGATQTPLPVLVLSDDQNNVFAESVGATTVQPTGSTVVYCWSDNMVLSGLQPATGADIHAQAPLPCGDGCFLLPGWKVAVHTVGIGANSQWSAIALYVVTNG